MLTFVLIKEMAVIFITTSILLNIPEKIHTKGGIISYPRKVSFTPHSHLKGAQQNVNL